MKKQYTGAVIEATSVYWKIVNQNIDNPELLNTRSTISGMKKIHLIFSALLLVDISLLLFFYLDLKKQQILFHEQFLSNHLTNSKRTIEKTSRDLEKDIRTLLNEKDLTLPIDSVHNANLIQRFKNIIIKYPKLISNIKLYDRKSNVFSIYKDKKDDFIIDIYTTQTQRPLLLYQNYEFKNKNHDFIFPRFKNGTLDLNLVITVNYNSYLTGFFDQYYSDNLYWQWLIDKSGPIIFNNQESILDKSLTEITKNITNNLKGSTVQKVNIHGKTQTVLFSHLPVKFLRHKLTLVFSFNLNKVLSALKIRFLFLSILSIVFLIVAFIIFKRFLFSYHQNEQKGIQSEKNLIQIFDSIPIGVLILTPDKTIRHINRTACEFLYGINEKNIIGRNIADKIIPKYFNDRANVESAYDTNHFYSFEKDGTEVVIYKKDIPFILDNENLLIEAFIDISPLEKSRKLEAASNLAKSDFLAKMSHEIRTPLNGIVGMADALVQQNLTPEQQEFAEIIKKSSDLLLTIINDVLDYSKIEAGKMILEEIPFKVSDEIDFARELFKPLAEEKKLKISTLIAPNVPNNIIGDPFRLRQVLSNLLSNAVKFTHKGEVVLKVELQEEYDGNLTLLFSVEDTGIGIPQEKLETIFSSYTQAEGYTTRKYGGSGLGTTISKQLVELMSGEIWVESPSSISTDAAFPGTRFCFTMEAYSNERVNKNMNFNHISQYGELNSLIITDSGSDGESIYRYLSNFGTKHDIFIYQNGNFELLIDKLLSAHRQYHLVFIKDSLAFDGFRVAKLLFEKGITQNHLFVFLSSRDNAGNFIKAKRLGMDYYLIKPYESSEIFNIIQDNFPAIKNDPNIVPKVNQIRKDISILVAEDNLINQKVAKTIFKNLGYEIAIAKNGVEAIDMALENSYDIVFMDMMMPEKDGVQATKDLRKQGYKKPIIAMTANATKEGKNHAISFGMDGYVTKPTKIEAIKKILIKYFSETVNEV